MAFSSKDSKITYFLMKLNSNSNYEYLEIHPT